MSKFKVGDVVRVVDQEECDIGYFKAGDICRIISRVCHGVFNADFTGHGNETVVEDGKWAVCDYQLELVTPA